MAFGRILRSGSLEGLSNGEEAFPTDPRGPKGIAHSCPPISVDRPIAMTDVTDDPPATDSGPSGSTVMESKWHIAVA